MADMTAALLLSLRDRLSPGLGRASQKFGRLQQSGQAAIGKLNAGLGKLNGTLAALGVSIGGVAFLKQAVGAFTRFDNAMTAVGFKAGATGLEIAAMRTQAKELGATTQFSAGQAAQAMENLATAGLNTKQILQTTPKVLALAAAGKLGLAEASTIAATALKQFDLEADQSGRVSDVLARQANASMTNVSELGQALGNAGTNAQSLGVPLEEAIAALGGLADVGLRASEGGTGLSQVMSRLKAPVGAAQKALNELEVSAYDGEGKFIGLTKTMGLLKEALKDKTPQEQAKALTDIFGQEASKAANGYLAKVEEIQRAYEENQRAAGYADAAAQKMTDNLDGDLKGLASRWEALQITLTEGENAPLRGLVQNLSDVLAKLNELAGDPKKMQALKWILGIGLGSIGAYKIGRGAYNVMGRLRKRRPRDSASPDLMGAAGRMGASPVYVTNWPAGIGGRTAGREPFGGGRAGKNFLRSLSRRKRLLGMAGRGIRLLNTTGTGRMLARGGRMLGRFGGPALGVGLGVMDSAQALGNDQLGRKQKSKAVGGAAGGTIGAIAGGALGTLIPIPGMGTTLGAMAGGFIGDKLGTLVGGMFGRDDSPKVAPVVAQKPEPVEVTVNLEAQMDESTRLRVSKVASDNRNIHINTGHWAGAQP